jgi:multiple sugar transport system substrate-binding protein
MAFEFVKFATADPQNAKLWNIGTGTVPALKAVADDPTLLDDLTWLGPSLDILEHGRYVGPLPDRDKFWYEIVAPHVTNYLQGNETVDEALQAIDDEANATFQ